MDLEILVPSVEPFAGERRKPGRIELQLFLEPMVSSDECALSRLPRATDRFGGKKFCEGGIELGDRIRLSMRRHEKSGIVLLALIPSEEPLPVMQQEMPFPLVGKVFVPSLGDQVLKIGVMIGLLSMSDDRGEKTNCDNEWNQHGVTRRQQGP